MNNNQIPLRMIFAPVNDEITGQESISKPNNFSTTVYPSPIESSFDSATANFPFPKQVKDYYHDTKDSTTSAQRSNKRYRLSYIQHSDLKS
jgi:hypothetical protein